MTRRYREEGRYQKKSQRLPWTHEETKIIFDNILDCESYVQARRVAADVAASINRESEVVGGTGRHSGMLVLNRVWDVVVRHPDATPYLPNPDHSREGRPLTWLEKRCLSWIEESQIERPDPVPLEYLAAVFKRKTTKEIAAWKRPGFGFGKDKIQ